MMVKNGFTRATRKKAKLRLALTGVSGSGKTYSALMLAKGLGGNVACIDTESCSASLYSHLMEFDVLELSAPFSPNKYIDAITQAEEAGYSVLIIDSLSAAWAGSGGVLEMVDEITRTSKSKNSYMAWSTGSKEQEKLIQKILTSSLHIICCMRSKTAYELMDNGQGRKTPVKVGLQPIQRDNTEYEFQLVFDISRDNHFAVASKDRTEIFKDNPFLITEKTGQSLIEWLDKGVEAPKVTFKNSIDALLDNIKACSNTEDLTILYKDGLVLIDSEDDKKDLIKACAIRKQEILKNTDVNDITYAFQKMPNDSRLAELGKQNGRMYAEI
jgi:hypothetical protein